MTFRTATFRTAALGISGGGALLLIAVSAFPRAQADTPPRIKAALTATAPGAALFAAQCAPCHGAKGQGSAAYARTLTGNMTAAQLAKYIAAEMPPGPKHCTSADAARIAPYIYDAFYSPIAQERGRPARVALSRLTVRQYRNSVADLVGSFRRAAPVTAGAGLRAEYFKARNFSPAERVLEQVDPGVQFDWGTGGPRGGAFNPHQFSVRWSGSVIAPETGLYDFVVRTDHGLRLWVNDRQKPVIDASVKSGGDTVYRASLFLISGRAYPIRLEFSKSTQGVDDTKQKEGKPAPPASITLAWKRPRLAEEPIPARCLAPADAAETFVVTAPFPPDDRSRGYETGSTISKEWDDATTAGALETADYVARNLPDLAGSADDAAKVRAFCRAFVERALRRPLDAETAGRYVDHQFAVAPDLNTAVKRVVLLTLKSPRFLFRETDGGPTDPYNVASRLSYALWDAPPDAPLLAAAASGGLATRAQVETQSERMASDPRAWTKQREFLHQWLKIDQTPDLTKDAARFPGFTPAAQTDLRTSLDMGLQSIVRSDTSDYRDLFLTDTVFLNGRLAKLYGAALPPDAPFQPVALDPAVRAGVLTHPYLMASFSYVRTSSPIHRGVLLARNILGRVLQPPPAAFAPLAADLHPDLTTRQRVALQTRPATCQSCHGIINPLGFTLERFDAIGRLRDTENNKPVDTTGGVVTRTGKWVKFTGSQDLARYIATSDEAHEAFVEKLFQFSAGQPIRAYGPQTLSALKKDFAANQYSIRHLSAEIATTAALPGGGTGKASVARGE